MSTNALNKRRAKRVHRYEFSSLGGVHYLSDLISRVAPLETPLWSLLTKAF